jgi:carboxypeptidase Taq
MDARASYQELIRRSREVALIGSCAELLAWDEDTYMPPGGVENRARQLAYLAGLQHKRSTDPRLGDLVNRLKDDDLTHDPLSAEAVNVRELLRSYDRQTRLPRELVEESARVTSLSQHEWAVARRNADFAHFLPWLERVVALKRREAEALGGTDNLYDALLEDYEPGTRGADLARLFDELRHDLAPLALELAHASRRPNVAALHRDFPVDSGPSARRRRRRSASTSTAAASTPRRTPFSAASAPATRA